MSEKATIVNIKHDKCDIYCGRPSIYGNPFEIGRDGTRDDVIEKYKSYFYKKIKDPKFKQKVFLLRGKKLGCWCAPLRCHLEVIIDYLENESIRNT